MNGGRPVRPRRQDSEREMCVADEDDGGVFGYKAEQPNRGEDQEEAPEEEGLIPKIKKAVAKPTAEEVEQHMATHIPFRDWYPHCVAGKVD